jgi:copper chaperone
MSQEENLMEKTKFSVPNISCGHCVMTIQKELSEIDGVFKVEGDPTKKDIAVEWDSPASIEKIKATLKEINYPATE